MMENLTCEPLLLICNASAPYQVDQVCTQLVSLAPQGCKIAGSTSCLGAMNDHGFHAEDGFGLSLIAFSDDKGDFGIALLSQGDKPSQAAADAVSRAIKNADRPGELPDLIWLSAAPGHEEDVLAGIASVVGPSVPVVGGSSGDNTISGEWWQFSMQAVEQDGVLVIAMYPECKLGISFHSGYAPTSNAGIVTKSYGRTIHTIDDLPAAEVYNRWTNGLIEQNLGGGNILATSTFSPLGLEAGRIENIPYYALMHPEQVLEDGSITLFSNISTGDHIRLMEGSPESLTSRAGTVTQGIIDRHNWSEDQLAGALVIYCAGCMLGIRERMDQVSDGIHQALGGKPFQGSFTFGEQGCFTDGINRHANLMIAVVIFSNRAE